LEEHSELLKKREEKGRGGKKRGPVQTHKASPKGHEKGRKRKTALSNRGKNTGLQIHVGKGRAKGRIRILEKSPTPGVGKKKKEKYYGGGGLRMPKKIRKTFL